MPPGLQFQQHLGPAQGEVYGAAVVGDVEDVGAGGGNICGQSCQGAGDVLQFDLQLQVASGGQEPPLHHRGDGLDVDVPAGEEADRLARDPRDPAVEKRRQGDRPGPFHQELGPLQERHDGQGDLLLFHQHTVIHQFPDDGKGVHPRLS